MEIAYRQALGLVTTLAKLLGKPSPVMTRVQRRALRELGLLSERGTETDA